VTLMMRPAAPAQGQAVPDYCCLQAVTPWLSQCLHLGAQVGSISTSILSSVLWPGRVSPGGEGKKVQMGKVFAREH